MYNVEVEGGAKMNRKKPFWGKEGTCLTGNDDFPGYVFVHTYNLCALKIYII